LSPSDFWKETQKLQKTAQLEREMDTQTSKHQNIYQHKFNKQIQLPLSKIPSPTALLELFIAPKMDLTLTLSKGTLPSPSKLSL